MRSIVEALQNKSYMMKAFWRGRDRRNKNLLEDHFGGRKKMPFWHTESETLTKFPQYQATNG